MTYKFSSIIALICCIGLTSSNLQAASLSGAKRVFQPLQLDVDGPFANETDTSPNPFLDIRLDVIFTSPSGKTYRVPGFFAGDGAGNSQGNIWRTRFTPEQAGNWQYSIQMFGGNNAAVAEVTNDLDPISEDSESGNFLIAPADANAPGFLKTGRLSYADKHYLRFTNNTYWIKGGVDSPENFFGYAGFDNTINQAGGVGEAQLIDGVHRYANHISDWQLGDPLFTSADTGVDSKGIIGAVNYLASEGINSMYFLLMNLGGDGRETYPFIGATGSAYDNTHYDVSKLHQWNVVLQHMQHKSIAAHFVLGEQEQENKNWLDGGELGVERKLYYREMVARFSYLNAVKWNISEESRYGAEKHIAFASTIRSLDWAKHPIAVHSFVDDPGLAYDALLGNSLFNISSIQFSAENADEFTETWREKTAAAGIPWVIDMDEVGPGSIGLTEDNIDQMRREVLYPVYFSGGNVEWYFGFLGADIRTENFRTREPMYRYMRYAREFIEQHLPFWDMQPDDDALIGGHTNDQVFAKSGDTYAIYLNDGSREPRLNVQSDDYTLQWFNPRNGLFDTTINEVSGDQISIGAAPSQPEQDWVVLVKKAIVEDETPIAQEQEEEGQEQEQETVVEATPTPTLGGANSTSNGSGRRSGEAGWLFLAMPTLILYVRLLRRFRRRGILTSSLNMLRIQSIKVNRVK